MKTAVFYYTQSGQALDVAKSICSGIEGTVVFKRIEPIQAYRFPWNKDDFFNVMPETRLGLPPSGIEPMDLADVEDANLVMIVGQSWFLSPSLPLQSFFSDSIVSAYLRGKNVIFVNACRNMWLMTSRKVKTYLHDSNAKLIGHIVIQDRRPNLISALTIVRWLLYGRKEASWLMPEAGVADTDLTAAAHFGKLISNSLRDGDFLHLQAGLLTAGAIDYKPSIVFLEKAGHRMFGFWAQFIRKKGGFKDAHRRLRVNLFFYYLIFVLFIVSPFGQLFFYLTYPLHHVKRNRYIDCNV